MSHVGFSLGVDIYNAGKWSELISFFKSTRVGECFPVGMHSVPVVLWYVTYQFTLSSQPLSSYPLPQNQGLCHITFIVILNVCHIAWHTADTPYSPLFHTFVGLLEFMNICKLNERMANWSHFSYSVYHQLVEIFLFYRQRAWGSGKLSKLSSHRYWWNWGNEGGYRALTVLVQHCEQRRELKFILFYQALA